MEYIVIEEQDLDWQPVIRKFATEGLSDGFLNHVTRPNDGGKIGEAIAISDKAKTAGFESVRDLFNAWYNLKAQGKIK